MNLWDRSLTVAAELIYIYGSDKACSEYRTFHRLSGNRKDSLPQNTGKVYIQNSYDGDMAGYSFFPHRYRDAS